VYGIRILTSRKTTAREPEERVLKRIFGYNREEVTGAQRKLCKGEFHNLYVLLTN
jgi:hypothetical protein